MIHNSHYTIRDDIHFLPSTRKVEHIRTRVQVTDLTHSTQSPIRMTKQSISKNHLVTLAAAGSEVFPKQRLGRHSKERIGNR
jgi:hypothetical protein